jgi:enoyl-CoA hydratase
MALAAAIQECKTISLARVTGLSSDGGNFCAGVDLCAIGSGSMNDFEPFGDGLIGATRMVFTKPVIAAVDGYAVARDLELALWCDLRVMEIDAIVGVFCRRFGVSLVDGGTVRLHRIVGGGRGPRPRSHRTSRWRHPSAHHQPPQPVGRKSEARRSAIALALEITTYPQVCMREEQLSECEGLTLSEVEALHVEYQHVSVAVQA